MTPSTTPGDDRRRDMSPDEKLIAQWEAQHDVAARGHRGDPLGLQRSLSRERLADCARQSRGPGLGATAASAAPAATRPAPDEPAGVSAADVCAVPSAAASAASPPAEPAPARRHPWRRFHRHASEH